MGGQNGRDLHRVDATAGAVAFNGRIERAKGLRVSGRVFQNRFGAGYTSPHSRAHTEGEIRDPRSPTLRESKGHSVVRKKRCETGRIGISKS